MAHDPSVHSEPLPARKRDAAWAAAATGVEVWAWELLAFLPLTLVLMGLPLPVWSVTAASLAVLAAFFWWHVTRYDGGERRLRLRDLRLAAIGSPGLGWLAAGVVVSLVLLLMINLVVLVSVAPEPTGEGQLGPMLARPWGWLPLFLSAAVLGPIFEEVLLRGRLQVWLERRWRPSTAVGITAITFAVAHLSLVRAPSHLAAGLVLGGMAYLTGSVWPSVVLHALQNALGTLALPALPEAWRTLLHEDTALLVMLAAIALTGSLLVPIGRRYAAARARPRGGWVSGGRVRR